MRGNSSSPFGTVLRIAMFGSIRLRGSKKSGRGGEEKIYSGERRGERERRRGKEKGEERRELPHICQ